MTRLIDQTLVDALVADARDVWPERFDEIEQTFDRCCLSIALDAVHRLGLFQRAGETETLASIREKVNLFADAGYVLDKVLHILCAEKVLERRGDAFVCLDPEPWVEPPAESLVAATRAFPDEGAAFQWLARAHDGLVRFLTGAAFAEEVLFPQGSFTLTEEVYNTSGVYGFYAKLAARAVRRIVERLPGPATVIEVGGGTANGTVNVLGQTSDRFTRYVFTDVSAALVQRGQRRLRKTGHGFFEYRELDIGRDVAAQGFEEAAADLVLAVNVIHATDDVVEAVAQARRLLKPGGWLVMAELSPPPEGIYRYMELTFGLLPSYARYRDTELRPLAPVLRPAAWLDVLGRAGFAEMAAIPGDRLEGVDRGGIVVGVR